jgi:hypothetical protein
MVPRFAGLLPVAAAMLMLLNLPQIAVDERRTDDDSDDSGRVRTFGDDLCLSMKPVKIGAYAPLHPIRAKDALDEETTGNVALILNSCSCGMSKVCASCLSVRGVTQIAPDDDFTM